MMIGGDLPHPRAPRARRAARAALAVRQLSRCRRTIRSAPRSTTSISTCAPARSSASPACPATARRSCSRRCPASARRAPRTPCMLNGVAGGRSMRRAPARAGPRVRPGGAAAARRGAGDVARRQRAAHRASTAGMVAHGFDPRRGGARASLRRHHRRVQREGRRAGTRRRAASRAATCRNSSSAARSCRDRGCMIAAQPTWGVDVGAAAADPAGADRSARRRCARCWSISEELDELFEICDRIAVIAQRPAVAGEAGARHRRRGDRPADERAVHRGGARRGARRRRSARMLIRLEARPSRRASMSWLSPLVAAAATLVIGFVLFTALGKNPVQALFVFFIEPIATLYGVGELLLKASPLMLCAVGLAVGYRANVWNIGAEGQLTLGAICGGGVALALRRHGRRLAAAAHDARRRRSAAWHGRRFRPGCARASTPTRSSSSLMLVYVADAVAVAARARAVARPRGLQLSAVDAVRDAALLPILLPDTRLNVGFLIALAAVAAGWLFIAPACAGFQHARRRAGARARRATPASPPRRRCGSAC